MQILQSYHWPERAELRNTVESMLVLERGKFLDADDVRKHLKDVRTSSEDRNLPVPISKSVEQAERELILRALLDIKGNIMELRNLLAEQNQMICARGRPAGLVTREVLQGARWRTWNTR
jgi:DNA-binding NtrC family response regulator